MTFRSFVLVLALAACVSFATTAQADEAPGICVYDGFGPSAPACPKAPENGDGSTYIGAHDEVAARINTGLLRSQTPIIKHGVCRFVNNTGPSDYFIPFKSEKEWKEFRDYPHQTMWVNTCALAGTYNSPPLQYGPTSARNEAPWNDTTANTHSVTLPNWPTGENWPRTGSSEHKFEHSCYEEYPEKHCYKWTWVSQTCTACDETDIDGNCIKSHTYDCSYNRCDDWGSICAKNWSSWDETFNFLGTALNSETSSPSWTGRSSKVGGTTRPNDKCTRRCEYTGHDCINCSEPEKPPEKTVCVAQTMCLLMPIWSHGGGTEGGRTLTNVMGVVANHMLLWIAAMNDGDCVEANTITKTLNDYVRNVNFIQGYPPDYCYTGGP